MGDFNDSESAATVCPRRVMHMTGLRSMITIIMELYPRPGDGVNTARPDRDNRCHVWH
jgi:hypothetical protein